MREVRILKKPNEQKGTALKIEINFYFETAPTSKFHIYPRALCHELFIHQQYCLFVQYILSFVPRSYSRLWTTAIVSAQIAAACSNSLVRSANTRSL